MGGIPEVPPLAEKLLTLAAARGGRTLSSEMWPLRGGLCSRGQSCIHAHTGSTKWTQWI